MLVTAGGGTDLWAIGLTGATIGCAAFCCGKKPRKRSFRRGGSCKGKCAFSRGERKKEPGG